MSQEEEQEARFERIILQLQEWFPDYYVAVRYGKGGAMWRSSDATWARGVCDRYAERQRETDRMDLEEKHDNPPDES